MLYDYFVAYLGKFHHHMRKDVQEADNSIPQSTVSQRLLVTSTGTLKTPKQEITFIASAARYNLISNVFL